MSWYVENTLSMYTINDQFESNTTMNIAQEFSNMSAETCSIKKVFMEWNKWIIIIIINKLNL